MAAPLSARAADRHWDATKVGGSEEAPYDIWDTTNWDGAVGAGNQLHLSVSEKTYISSTSSTQIANDFAVDSGDFVFIGPLKFYCFKNTTANATVNIVKKGDWEVYNYEFWGGTAEGVHLTFTNESGNLTKTGSNRQTIYLAEGSNSEVEFYHQSGTMTAAQYGVILGRKTAKRAYLEISGGIVKNTAGNIALCEINTDTGVGELKITGGELQATAGSIIVGANGRGVFTVEGGLATASANGVLFCANPACVSGRDCFLNLNGGTLATKTVKYGSGAAAATFTLNGGTLRALQAGTLVAAHNNLSVKVGAGGAKIDTAGYDITIAEDLDDATGETGKLTFTGNGGTVRLTGAVNYTGVTYLNEQTHLVVADGTAKDAILSRGLTVLRPVGVSAEGTHILLSCADGTPCTTADLASVTLGAGLDGATLSIVDGAIAVTVTRRALTWAGATGVSASWDGANWNGGASWTDGNDAIFATDGAIADVDTAATASTVTFSEDATIAGSASLTVPVVSVADGVTATISAPFGGDFAKTGAGTLVLPAKPATTLTLLEGALSMDGGTFDGIPATTAETDATLTNGTYGTASGVFTLPCGTLRFASDAALASQASVTIGTSATDAATLVKDGGDWTVSGNFFICKTTAGTTATFIHRGGTLTAGSYLSVGDVAGGNLGSMEISGGTVRTTHTGSYTIVGANNDGMLTVKGSGTLDAAGSLLVAHSGDGTVVIDNGGSVTLGSDVIFAYAADAGDGLVDLKTGGSLLVKRIWYNAGTSALSTFRFNGGTVMCSYQELITAHDRLFVKVTANGGIIDVNGFTVAVHEPILEDAESTGGGMTFKGGGKITLAAGNTYTGATTVEVGTTVLIPEPGAIVGGLAVTVPATAPADGVYVLLSITGEGTFPASALTGVAAPAGCRLVLSADGKSVLCVYGNPDPAWIGGASGSLSVGANWSTGVVPTGDNCIIGNVTEANLTVGDTFAAISITFPAETALVTISGERTLSGVTAIVNHAPFHHVFNCPIVCADGITPDITRGSGDYMVFAGGITMYDAPKTGSATVDYWSGNVTLTTESEQRYVTSGNYGDLVPGTTFSFNNGNIDHMFIDAGATAVVERLVYNNCVRSSASGGKTAYFNVVFDNGNGVVRTKEVRTTGDAVLFHSYAGADLVGGTIIAEKLTCAATKKTGGGFPYPVFMLNCGGLTGTTVSTGGYNGEGVWVIGPGGLSFPETAIYAGAHYETKLGKTLDGRPAATLHSYADWTLMAHPSGRATCALQIGDGNGGFLVIDTSHYAIGDAEYDSATSHTVTLDGMVTVGPMHITGNGKVVFSNENSSFGGLTVQDTATASVKVGCKPGNGLVTVNSGATLEVAESGAVALGGGLTLVDGAALGFNFTEKATAPVLDVTGKTVALGENGTVVVKVSAAEGKRAKGGAHVLTSGGAFTDANVTLAADAPDWAKGVSVNADGNIVLEAIPSGFILIVR
ncbi:MAG: hypothetical protein J6Z49_10640 [Kiritimatiellae bacterium]|nr:hypothetical protein [Kiritimatiellia bacterium]